MSAKFLHSLADDNPNLQKQIGCMTGICQLIDRHHIITAHRVSQKRHPPDNSHFNCDSRERGSNSIHHRQSAADMRLSNSVSEKQRISTESSRPSFSSSCSSSISSLSYKARADAPFERIVFRETPMKEPVMNQTSISPHIGCHSLDLRDAVKDSMYREARGLSNDKDISRPLQLSKSINGKQSVPIDLKQSLQVLAKLREAPWHYVESRELPRLSYEVKDQHWYSISKDAPRFSYDGRETSGISFESHDSTKCPPKLKELPRLSLDSREGAWRAHSSNSKPTNLSRNFNTSGASNSFDNISSQQQPSATRSRPPSVVAKLMGLEPLPESYLASDTKSSLSETGSTQGNDQCSKDGLIMPLRVSDSAKSSVKDPTSPRWKNHDLVVKPISSSRLPVEPAPWKLQDGNQSSQKQTSRTIKATTITPEDSFPSVYSDIEKRLSDLEFKQSRRDLRALKQILEAMQVKGLLEARKEEQTSNVDGNKRYNEPKPTLIHDSVSVRQQIIRGSDSAKTLESPIVIMKPEKHTEKTGISASSIFQIEGHSDSHTLQSSGVHAHDKKRTVFGRIEKDQSLRSSHKDSPTNFSEKKASSSKCKAIKSAQSQPRSEKNSGSVSPRKSRLNTPPSDLNKSRKQSCKQTTESGSPGRKLRRKVPSSQYIDDQLSETSNELRSLSCQWDEMSLQSDSITVDSKMDIEDTSNSQSAEIIDCQNPSMKAIEHLVSGSMQKKSTRRWDEDESIVELATDAPDHPSPVSVLDASVYKYDMPSPVRLISNAHKAGDAQESKENEHTDQWNRADGFLVNHTGNGEINREKLQSIDRLVQKLRQLNSSHDETRIDYIASLCENTNPDHRYISEILLVSGLLLRDLSSELLTFQHHSSGYPINPELFLVLEQTKLSTLLSKEEKVAYMKLNIKKFHRKLIFDTVNEILGVKLGSSLDPWMRHKRTKKILSAQKLLKELCFEIEKLQSKKLECSLEDEGDGLKSMLWEDVMPHSEMWTNFHGEIPGFVLDVERMIFRDLVDEIVIGEAACLRVKLGRRHKLFGK
ncbi:protein LONGIFOLIA 1-like [Abrus precatorius]|uniref:Protein LONGIFOLIA 1-like n=1 Tax=Abrus precatorius TaxID=3816 RepID=A0A8B8MJA4_ABRPR|nr:protein LONGIFOLIA 1-like [Abrus precatorius]